MIDPLLSLAFAMQTKKGVYALLLGSGVSRAAQIPTGWEIVLDLIEKLAQMCGESCNGDPAQWYFNKYGEQPDYSRLLDAIARSPEERQQLLSGYFEPKEDEREQGLKAPTPAHHAIAGLVVSGFVRVILTTNFDRLTERAIEEAGITPTVLSTPDEVEGALPLVHQRCVVIKVHGDYLDTRIKNTPKELAVYDDRVNSLLDRILDEFGFVICGWSAQWDVALCDAFDRCKSRRFTTFWASRGEPTDRAKRLIQSRAASTVSIQDADSFFTELGEKVASLEQLQQANPLSVAAAIATVTRFLAEEKYLIRLHDLVKKETERACKSLQAVSFVSTSTKSGWKAAIAEFHTRTELLRTIAVYGAFWGKLQHQAIFAAIPRRFGTYPGSGGNGFCEGDADRLIPSIMVLYQMGLAACANDNVEMLYAILTGPCVEHQGKKRPYLTSIHWPRIPDWFAELARQEGNWCAASECLFHECRDTLRLVVLDDSEYEHCFDRFEVIRSLAHIDLEHGGQMREDSERVWGPPGRFAWKYVTGLRHKQGDLLDDIMNERGLAKRLLGCGLFDGKSDRLGFALDKFKESICRIVH